MQITTGEEDRAGAVMPTQDVLFAVVWAVAGDIGGRTDATRPGALCAVNATVVAAKVTVV